MAAPSKLWMNCSCYELGHCWSPSCTEATLSILRAAVKYSVKLYAVFYLVSCAYRLRRNPTRFRWKSYLIDVLQSSSFLSTNVTLVIASFCVFRNLIGAFYPGFGFICSVPACTIAILMERAERRGLLALYVMNLAIEVLFNMSVQRGLITPIKYGEVLLFAASSAVLFYMYRYGNCLTKEAQSALKLLVGGTELPASCQEGNQETEQTTSQSNTSGEASPKFAQFLPKHLQLVITHFVKRLQNFRKHSLCLHKYSCAYYFSQAFLRKFLVGYSIQGVINLLKALPRLSSKPANLLNALYHKSNFSLGLFLGLYSGLFRMCSCILRWIRNKDNPVHALIAGFIAGLSSMFYRSSTISLYVAIKLGENIFYQLQNLKYLPIIPYGNVILYAVSTSVILQAAVFEPHNIRPAYWRFLLGLTGDKFALMNRRLLDSYGSLASKMYPDYWPRYDTRYTPLLREVGLV